MEAILDIGTKRFLAILNFYVAPMPPIKFRLNLTYGLGDVVCRISGWPLWRPSCVSEIFLAIPHLCVTVMPPIKFGSVRLTVWEDMSFEEFQDGHRGGHLEYLNGPILAILNLCVTVVPLIKFWLNPTYGWKKCRLKNFKMAAMATVLDIGSKRF